MNRTPSHSLSSLRRLAFALIWLSAGAAHAAETTLLPLGASGWRFLDTGQAPPADWAGPGFDDTGWGTGPAPLGYGENDEGTVVSFGPDPTQKFITTWFRADFSVTDPTAVTAAKVRFVRDDGAVAYLNGSEVARSNMPPGPIDPTTLATTGVGSANEGVLLEFDVDPDLLVAGTNVVAVEVHQYSPTSNDLRLDLEVAVQQPVQVVRGPYLQLGTDQSVRVRWRTDLPHHSQLLFGSADSSMTGQIEDMGLTTEHELELTGLPPARRAFYAVGTPGDVLAGGDGLHYFDASPAAGAPADARFWVLGDPGTGNATAKSVRDQFLAWSAGNPPDLILTLGDNAYPDGTDAEFQTKFFDMFGATLRNTTVWAGFGNHDAHSASAATETGPYFDAFTLPRNAEAGGVPSQTEAYYSFDYGDVHFIALDAHESSKALGDPMMTWLQADLDASQSRWTIAYWHQSPYSKGSHDSDQGMAETLMRQNALPILEAGGVDLVLSGHSHGYERSFLLGGHYGTSDTLDPSMILGAGDGRPSGDGAYVKNSQRDEPHQGTVYVVAGSSGKTSTGPFNHPVMVESMEVAGSVAIDVRGAAMDVHFIDATGTVRDAFQILKQSECSDGLDNDGDGNTDGADGQCGQPGALSEFPECSDGLDNDGDGLVDGADPACTGTGTLEAPACQDGIDNDGDGTIDYDGMGGAVAPDPNCNAPWRDREFASPRLCGGGPELALLLPLLAALRRGVRTLSC